MLPPSVKCVLGGVLNGGGSTSTFSELDFPNHNANRVWTPTNFTLCCFFVTFTGHLLGFTVPDAIYYLGL